MKIGHTYYAQQTNGMKTSKQWRQVDQHTGKKEE